MAQSQHAEFAEDRFRAERSDASLGRLVTSDEEMGHAVVDMVVDGAVRAIMRAGAEVAAPAAQETVEGFRTCSHAGDFSEEPKARLLALIDLARQPCEAACAGPFLDDLAGRGAERKAKNDRWGRRNCGGQVCDCPF